MEKMNNILERTRNLPKNFSQNLKQEEENKCPKCNGLKYIFNADDTVSKCDCFYKHYALESLKRYGLSERVKENSFSNYIATTEEQEDALATAIQYTIDFTGTQSILLSGQVGTGKTHLALSIIGNLVEDGKAEINVLMYTEEMAKLKTDRRSFDADTKQKYQDRIKSLQECKLLLIEDFFWGSVDKETLEVIYEIINYRYNNKKATIITTEMNKEQLAQIDEALGSRIYQMCNPYIIEFVKNKNNNYRYNAR